MTEAEIQRDVLAYLATRLDIQCWRNNAGVASLRSRFVRFGIRGQADISGMLAPTGRRLEIEVKTQAGRQSADQKAFQAMIEKYGGLYLLVRSVHDVKNALPLYEPSHA